MKKALLLVMILSFILSAPCAAFAAEGDFVPSISYKGAPELVGSVDPDGNKFWGEIIDKEGAVTGVAGEGCLIVTSVADAKNSTQISAEAKALLLSVYDELNKGTMKLPYEKIREDLKDQNMVIRDLFDVSWVCEEHVNSVSEKGVTLRVKFNLGIKENEEIYCLSYDNGEWVPAASLLNNGDGTVTVALENVGPVAFSVAKTTVPPTTGDKMASDIYIYVGLLAASGVALVVLLVLKRRKHQA